MSDLFFIQQKFRKSRQECAIVFAARFLCIGTKVLFRQYLLVQAVLKSGKKTRSNQSRNFCKKVTLVTLRKVVVYSVVQLYTSNFVMHKFLPQLNVDYVLYSGFGIITLF